MMKLLLALLLGLQSQTGTIQVSVRVAGTSKPLVGVQVTLTGPNRASTNATTDASGQTVFSNLPNGQYTIQAMRDGYFRKEESAPSSIYNVPASRVLQTISPLEGVAIAVFPPQMSRQVSIALVPFGSISGRVKNADGTPLKDALVSAASIGYWDGRQYLDEWNRIKTDAMGEYRFSTLGPGEYYVRADPPNAERAYVGTYYPGEADLKKATRIPVHGEGDVGGIDFEITTPKTFSVSGKVLNAPRRTLPDGKVESGVPAFALVPRDPATPDFSFPARLPNQRSSEDGEFLISGVPAGSWDLIPVITLEVRSIADPRTVFGRVPIEVAGADLRDVTITLASNTVKGRAVMAGGEPVPILLRGMLIPRDNTPSGYVGHLTNSRTLSVFDGAFTFEPVPSGRYSFKFQEIPAGYHLADIRLGSRSIYEDGIVEVGTQPVPPLEMVFGRGGAKITGKVEGIAAGADALEYASVRVALVPSRRRNLSLYQITPLSPDGSFSFWYVAPGEYKVFAWKSLPSGAEQSERFLANYEKSGTPVSAAMDVSNEISVQIIP